MCLEPIFVLAHHCARESELDIAQPSLAEDVVPGGYEILWPFAVDDLTEEGVSIQQWSNAMSDWLASFMDELQVSYTEDEVTALLIW